MGIHGYAGVCVSMSVCQIAFMASCIHSTLWIDQYALTMYIYAASIEISQSTWSKCLCLRHLANYTWTFSIKYYRLISGLFLFASLLQLLWPQSRHTNFQYNGIPNCWQCNVFVCLLDVLSGVLLERPAKHTGTGTYRLTIDAICHSDCMVSVCESFYWHTPLCVCVEYLNSFAV